MLNQINNLTYQQFILPAYISSIHNQAEGANLEQVKSLLVARCMIQKDNKLIEYALLLIHNTEMH